MSQLDGVARLRDVAQRRYGSFVERLEQLVNLDSGSRDLAGLDRVAGAVQAWAAEAGLAAQRVGVRDADGVPLGDAVVARVTGTGTARILLVGHLDTVFAPGTASTRPFRVNGGRAYGPGVCDDKGGVLAGIAAVEVLLATGRTAFGELILLATPDEEIGSIGSRPLLRRLARDAQVALCLECARENGDLVSARKGVADVEILLHGRAAHAGIEPERGVHTGLAAAKLTIDLQALNGRWPSVTVNVGVLQSGQRANVVPEHARLLVDLRAERVGNFVEALATIESIVRQTEAHGVRATVAVHAPAPPWEPAPATRALVELATAVGVEVGVDVHDAATGGCADANLLAAAGIAVLDGLGPVGGEDHSNAEWLDLASVTPRVALLAGLLDAAVRHRPTADGPAVRRPAVERVSG